MPSEKKVSSKITSLENLGNIVDLKVKADPKIENKTKKLQQREKTRQQDEEKNKKYGVIHVQTGERFGATEEKETTDTIIDDTGSHPKGFVRVGGSYTPKNSREVPYETPDRISKRELEQTEQAEDFADKFLGKIVENSTVYEGLVTKKEGSGENLKNSTEEEQLLLEQFKAFIAEIKMQEEAGKREKTNEEKMGRWEELSTEYGLQMETVAPLKVIKDARAIEDAEKKEIEREENIKKIGELLKQGVDKIVIHGNTFENNEGELNLAFGPDADTKGALYLLNDVVKIKYNEGAQTEIVAKGGQIPPEEGKVIIHVDVGGKTLSVENTEDSSVAFIDHHQENFDTEQTSATQLIYEILWKNNMLEGDHIDKEALGNFAEFITQIDNLSYIDSPKFDSRFLEDRWAKSLFGLWKELPIDKLVQYFKEGRDPWDPQFTKEEKKKTTWEGRPKTTDTPPVGATPEALLWGKEYGFPVYKTDPEGKQTTEVEHEIISLGGTIKDKQGAVFYAAQTGFPFAVEQMEKNGIKNYTKELGMLFFNTTDPQIGKDGKEQRNWLKGEIGFLMAKARGYDTYVSFNENKNESAKRNSYFMNSTTYNLDIPKKRLAEIVPGTILVRGVMLLGPQKSKDREPMTKEKFLRVLKLKE